MGILINVIIRALAIFISAYIIPGVSVDSFVTAIIVAVVLSVINIFIKPIVVLLTLPINILTLGLFTFVINALMILIVSAIVPGFIVDGVVTAILFAIVLSLVNSVLHLMAPKN